VNLYSAFLKNPKRAACASLVEREEKGFKVDDVCVVLLTRDSF